MSEKITVDIVGNIDLSTNIQFADEQKQIETMKNSLRELQKEANQVAPNFGRAINESLEKTLTIADSVKKKIGQINSGEFSKKEDRESFVKNTKESFKDLVAMHDLQTGDGAFSADLARSWFSKLPEATAKQFDKIIPRQGNMLRTKMNALSADVNKITATTFEGITTAIMGSAEFKKMTAKMSNVSNNEMKDFLRYYVANAVPAGRLNDYHVKRHGWNLDESYRMRNEATLASQLPKSYESSLFEGKYQHLFASKENNGQILKKDSVNKLRSLLATNPIAVRAAINSGISKRNNKGQLQIRSHITMKDVDKMREALYEEVETRGAGIGKPKGHFYDYNNQNAVINRLTSSSGGRAVLAINAFEELSNPDSYTEARGANRYLLAGAEAKRLLDGYQVRKYMPFRNENGVQKQDDYRNVVINESQATDIIGKKKWKNNQDISDTIREISLAGYDKENKEHRKLLEDIYSNGQIFDGRKYKAVYTHGTGEDTSIRLVSQEKLDEIEKEEQQWAKSVGFRGSYFGNFADSRPKDSVESWGKHLDAASKKWSSSYNTGINLEGKKIALVDFGEEGDGAGYLSSSIQPTSIQSRFGVAGKGSLFSVSKSNNYEFAKDAGLLDEEGRWMARGIDGKYFDISGYDGFIPTSLIKNKDAYKDANGGYLSSEETSNLLTEDMKRHGIYAIADYDEEKMEANHLGSQMTTFLKYSPELVQHQIDMANQVMRELDTDEGQLKHVFANPESDWIAQKVNEDRSFLQSTQARGRVEAFRESLLQRLGSGQYIDFGDYDSAISNVRAAASPLESFVSSHGGVGEKTLQIARKILEENFKDRKFTDDEIKDLIVLKKGTVIDFNHENEEQVGVLRSPTGYSNMVYAQNLARWAKPLYERFGISTTGAYVSKADLPNLQSMDYDGDRVKIVTGKLAESVEKTLEKVNEETKSISEDRKIANKATKQEAETDLTDEVLQKVENAERRVEASIGMGAGDAISTRGMLVDRNNPFYRPYNAAMVRGQGAYDISTSYPRTGEKAEIDPVMMEVMKLGKEYTKLPSHLKDFFTLDLDMMDNEGKPLEGADYFVASNKEIVNMREQKKFNPRRVNMPSANIDSEQASVQMSNSAYQNGQVDTKKWDALLEAMDHLGYDDAGEASQAAMKTASRMLVQFGEGSRTRISKEEQNAIREMIAAADLEMRVEADKNGWIDPFGKTKYDGKEYASPQTYLDARRRKYGLHILENAVNNFGLTDQNVAEYVSPEFQSRFLNMSTPNIVFLQEEKPKANYKPEEKTVSQSVSHTETPQTEKKSVEALKEEPASKRNGEFFTEDFLQNLIRDSMINNGTPEDVVQKMITGLSEKDVANRMIDLVNQDTRYLSKIRSGKEHTEAEKFFGLENWKMERNEKAYASAIKTLPEEIFGEDTAIRQDANDAIRKYRNAYIQATKNWSINFLDSSLESMKNALNDGDTVSAKADKSQIDSNKNKIEEQMSARDEYINSRQMLGLSVDDDEQIGKYDQGISDARLYYEKIRDKVIGKNDQYFDKEIRSLSELMTGKVATPAQLVDREIAQYVGKIEGLKSKQEAKKEYGVVSEDAYAKNAETLNSLFDYANGDQKNMLLEKSYNKTSKDISSLVARGSRLDLIHRRRAIDNTHYGRELGRVEAEYEQRKTLDENYRKQLETLQSSAKGMNVSSPAYKKATEDFIKLTKAIHENKQAMESLEGVRGNLSAGMQVLGDTITRVASRLGHQLMTKAMNELKRFTLEFSDDMAEIQSITLKSDDEMQGVRSSTLNDAVRLKTSVSNVSSIKADLYRQGLSDTQVDDRTESIQKFAKTSGAKVEDATKIITTALQNDLVGSAEEAMDALVALGDSAATTAKQIGDAMQKCAASAKVANVSYGELTSMLTVMTSMTQLSGKQVGTAMNTVQTRLHSVTKSGYAQELSGEKTTLNDVEAALSTIGVSLRDDQTGGWRDSTDVLLDIAKRWQGMNDIQKSLVSTSVAATRQGNMFQTLMEGLSEDGGETFAEYLNLAENSQGITDKKYEVSVRSLSAAIDTLTASYDRLVAGVESSQIGQTVLDFVSGILEGFGTLGEELPEVAAGLTGVIAPLSVIVGLIQAAKGGPGVGLFAGLGVAGLGMWIGSEIGKNSIASETAATQRKEQAASGYSNYITEINRRNESRNSLISETVSLGEQYEKLGEAMDEASSKKLESNLSSLITMFPELKGNISDATSVLSQWKTITDGAAESVKALTAEELNYAKIKAKVAASENFDDYVKAQIDSVTDERLGVSYEDIRNLAQKAKYSNFGEYVTSEMINEYSKAGVLRSSEMFGDKQVIAQLDAYAKLGMNTAVNSLLNDESLDIWNDASYTGNTTDAAFIYSLLAHPDIKYIPQINHVFDKQEMSDFKQLLALVYDKHTKELDPYYSNAEDFIADMDNGFKKMNDAPDKKIEILGGISRDVAGAIKGENEYIGNMYNQMQEAYAFAYGESVSHYISEYVSDYRLNHSGDELLATAVRKAFIESITNSETGAVDWSKINADYLNSEMPQIYEKVLAEGKEKYLSAEDYPYQMWRDIGNGIKRQEVFESVEQAEAYLKDQYGEENYKTYLGDIFDSNGNKVFRGADQIQNEQYLNWLKENQSYVSQMNALSRFANESSSLDDFAEKVPVDFDNLAGLLGQNDTLLKAWESTRTGNLSFDVFKKILRGQITGTNLLGHSDYMGMLPSFFGEDFTTQLVTGAYDTTSEENRNLLATAMTDPGMLDQLDAMKEKYPELTEVINAMTQGVELNAEAQKKLYRLMEVEGVRAAEKYNKNADKIADTYDAILKGGKGAEDTVQDLNQQMKQRDYAKYALNQFMAGKATAQDFSSLSRFFGFDEEQLKDAAKNMGSETSQWMLESMISELASYDQDLANVIEESVLGPINDFLLKNSEFVIPLKADGTVDASKLINSINQVGGNINATAAAYACSLSLQADSHQLRVVFNNNGKKAGGGGGGGGKSAADKIVENIKRQQAPREHLIKMIQFQETKFENNGEYGNQNKMIALENEAQTAYKKALEDNLVSLKDQLSKTKQGTDDWYNLREMILSTEEALEETNITIDENTKKMKENEEAIRQTKINLEGLVDSEIKNRVQKEKDMLAGSVSIQDIILEAIRKRYQEEWDLIKKDIERKKEALNEEKALIDERLNARKNAESRAEKYEELDEYKRQLAYISMDETRTKDAAETRKKIADLERDLAWDIAEDEADATKTTIDDELSAYDDYLVEGEEDLAEFLEDANNFADEIENILGLSHEDLMKWLESNVDEFIYSLDDAKKQILQTWEDLYKQMFGITDTNWEEIDKILSSKDSFLNYMMQSDEYINASDTDKESIKYEWGEFYDAWVSANKTDAEYSHEDASYDQMGTNGKTNTKTNTTGTSDLSGWAKLGSVVGSFWNLISPIFGFSSGGEVDYTGLAMVHGTPSKPEAFLSADDRVLVRSMIDSFSYARYVPKISNIDTGYNESNAHIDEVNIVINQAELNTDEDIEVVARKVGEAFAKDLLKAGFNTTKIGF